MNNLKFKHDIIADMVRKWLQEGRYMQGDQLPPDTELSEQFKVNKHTVAQGLNQLVSEGLLTRAPMRGTIVKKTLTAPPSNGVPLVSVTVGHFFSDLVRQLDQLLQAHDLFPILVNQMIVYETYDIISSLERIIRTSQPYGFLFIGEANFPYDYLKEKPLRFQNSVFIHHYHYPEDLPFCRYVLPDIASMGRQAVQYFAERGVKKILFPALCEPKYTGIHSSCQVQGMLAIKEEAAKTGIEFDESLFWRTHGGASHADMMRIALEDKSKTYGIFTEMDSVIARQELPILRDIGVDPDTVALLSQYNTPYAEGHGIDSFDFQLSKILGTAVDMLTGKCKERKILIEPELVIHRKK